MGGRLLKISIGALFLCLLTVTSTERIGTGRARRPYWSEKRDPVDRARDLILRRKFGNASEILTEALRKGLSRDRAFIAELQLALCQKELGYPEEAIGGFDRAKSRFPQLQDYLEFFRGECLEGQGLQDSALSVYYGLLRSDTENPASRNALFRIGDIYFSRGGYTEAIEIWKRAKGIDLSPGDKAEATLKLGKSFLRSEMYAEAYKALLEVMKLYPSTLHALEAAALIDSTHVKPDPMNSYWRGLVYLSSGEYDRAVEEFGSFGKSYPKRAWEANYYIGKSLYRKRDYGKAQNELRKVSPKSPNRYISGMARFYMARCSDKSGRYSEAKKRYIEFSKDFPEHPMAARALWNAGKLCETNGDFSEAREIYEDLSKRFPDSDFFGLSLWRIGFGLYKDGDYEGALRHFVDNAGRIAEGSLRDAFFFWAGKSSEKLGQEAGTWWEKASNAFPKSYYTVKAQAKLDTPKTILWRGNAGLYPGPEERKLESEDHVSFTRGVLLLELGLKDFAEVELRPILRKGQDDSAILRALSDEYERMGFFGKSFRLRVKLAKRVNDGRFDLSDEATLRVFYPEYYINLAEKFSEELELDPALVLAVIRRESFFDHMVSSSAGAVGLMQLMPSTGKFIAGKLGLRGIEVSDLTDPELNVRLGCIFLADQLRSFDDLVLALAAYNAGPSNVRRWIKRIDYSDPDEFVELIPFAETQNYIKEVLKDYSIYNLLIAG